MITKIFRTGDRDADIDSYLAAENAEDEKLIHCDICGEPIYDDDAWYIGDDWLCDDCAEATYKRRVYYD